jgi:hypothetical protein
MLESREYLHWELPLQMRFKINADYQLPYTENITVLVASANTGIDLEYSLHDDMDTEPDLEIYNFQYFCKFRMFGPWKHLKGPSSVMNSLAKHFSFPVRSYCAKFFGRTIVAHQGSLGACGQPLMDWMFDFRSCKGHESQFWNGIETEFNESINIITTPRLAYQSGKKMSSCTVALFAVGRKYFFNSLLQGERFKGLQSTDNESFCKGINVVIYTDDATASSLLVNDELYTTKFKEHIDSLYIIPDGSQLLLSSDEEILRALSNSAETMQHFPSLYWKRIFMLLYPPTRYVLYIDNEVFPCQFGYDRIFRYLEDNDIVTHIEELQEYGNTFSESR